MPSRKLPNTISSVIRTLTTARDAWAKYPTARLIGPGFFALLDPANPQSLLNRLTKEAGDVPTALAAQAPLTDASNQALARLTLHVSHFHQVYDFGVARSVFTAGGRAYYGRDVSSTTLPDLSSAAAVFEAAARIGPGETQRQQHEGANSVAMALPSAAQVAAVLAQAQTIHDQSEVAQAFTALQQDELAALYPEAQRVAVKICNSVEYHLENEPAYATLDAPGRRRIAQLWGVVYIYEDGTTTAPADAGAGNTTGAGPGATPPGSAPTPH